MGFRVRDVLLFLSGKKYYMHVRCRIVNCFSCFSIIFVDVHQVVGVHLVVGANCVYVVPHVVGVRCVFGFYCVVTNDYHVPNVNHVIGAYQFFLLSPISPLCCYGSSSLLRFLGTTTIVHSVVGVHHFCWFFKVPPLLFIVLLVFIPFVDFFKYYHYCSSHCWCSLFLLTFSSITTIVHYQFVINVHCVVFPFLLLVVSLPLPLPLHCPISYNFVASKRLLVACNFGKNFYMLSMFIFFPILCDFCSFWLLLFFILKIMRDTMFGFIYAKITYKMETLFATLKGTLNFYLVLLKDILK